MLLLPDRRVIIFCCIMMIMKKHIDRRDALFFHMIYWRSSGVRNFAVLGKSTRTAKEIS